MHVLVTFNPPFLPFPYVCFSFPCRSRRNRRCVPSSTTSFFEGDMAASFCLDLPFALFSLSCIGDDDGDAFAVAFASSALVAGAAAVADAAAFALEAAATDTTILPSSSSSSSAHKR